MITNRWLWGYEGEARKRGKSEWGYEIIFKTQYPAARCGWDKGHTYPT